MALFITARSSLSSAPSRGSAPPPTRPLRRLPRSLARSPARPRHGARGGHWILSQFAKGNDAIGFSSGSPYGAAAPCKTTPSRSSPKKHKYTSSTLNCDQGTRTSIRQYRFTPKQKPIREHAPRSTWASRAATWPYTKVTPLLYIPPPSSLPPLPLTPHQSASALNTTRPSCRWHYPRRSVPIYRPTLASCQNLHAAIDVGATGGAFACSLVSLRRTGSSPLSCPAMELWECAASHALTNTSCKAKCATFEEINNVYILYIPKKEWHSLPRRWEKLVPQGSLHWTCAPRSPPPALWLSLAASGFLQGSLSVPPPAIRERLRPRIRYKTRAHAMRL